MGSVQSCILELDKKSEKSAEVQLLTYDRRNAKSAPQLFLGIVGVFW